MVQPSQPSWLLACWAPILGVTLGTPLADWGRRGGRGAANCHLEWTCVVAEALLQRGVCAADQAGHVQAALAAKGSSLATELRTLSLDAQLCAARGAISYLPIRVGIRVKGRCTQLLACHDEAAGEHVCTESVQVVGASSRHAG